MSRIAVKTCKRCLYNTSHPLGLILDDEGICSGCRIHEEKDQLDWDERWDRLEQLVRPYRGRDSRNYDCIVPVSGAGDSFFIVHLVKERLKLNPLLVTYNRYYNTPLGIRNLAQLRRRFDCDILIQNVNLLSVKKIIRTTLREFGSFHWPVLAGQSVFPVQTALSHGVPLILWGAHQGLEQVGMFSHLHEVEMSRRYRKDHDLMGYEADDLLSTFDTLQDSDVWQYRYPSEDSLSSIGVRGIYLGNYVRWDPLAQHLNMVKHYGYKSTSSSRTFDVYDHVDDIHYLALHDQIKFAKNGFGKVTDQLCREIRYGRIKRTDAIKLNSFYLRQPAKNNNLLLSWLGIDKQGLDFVISQHVNNNNNDHYMSSVINRSSRPALPSSCDDFMTITDHDTGEKPPKYIIIGKGYP